MSRMKLKTKSKKPKISKTNNIEAISRTTAVNKNGSSILVDCSQCQKNRVIVKWNKPKKKYSEKSNLGYYTERDEDKEKWLCEKYIFQLYYQKKSTYWKLVPNLKKRQILRSYIYLKSLEVKD